MKISIPAFGFEKDDKKVSGKHSGILFILTLILGLASPCQLRAAEVANNSDEGAGSLRQAVADAEAGEIITFADSFIITLASPIVIDKDIVIDGGNSVTISGGEATSIFKITSGNVVISNIILKDGLAKGGNGGGSRGRAYGGGGGGAGMGGAIYAVDGVVAIENVTFQGNKAVGGNGGAQYHTPGVIKSSAGGGGNSSLGSGGGRAGTWSSFDGKFIGGAGGFGGGGGGGALPVTPPANTIGGMGGRGGFGGGAGGSAYYAYSNPVNYVKLANLTGRKSDSVIARGGQFGGNGGRELVNDSAGSGGGGAGLGGALFIQGATVTIKNSSFTGNAVQNGVAGEAQNGMAGTAGQAVGGAIFVYQDAVLNSWGGVSYVENSAQTSDADYYIMEGGEYDTAQSVLAGTFTGEVTEGDEGDISSFTGTISITDADADDNPSFEDVELSGKYGALALAAGTWIYTLDQTAAQAFQQGRLRVEKFTLTATDGTQQVITIDVIGSNDVPVGVVATAVATKDGDTLSGQLSSTDADKVVFFEEDFESLSLKPFESSSESGGDGTDWTDELLTGWEMMKGSEHGVTNGGTVVKEFDGWTFVDPVSWNKTAGQNRNLFTKGTGVIAVADPDEFDDLSDAKFDAALISPSIDISGAVAGSLILKFDSSWRGTAGPAYLTIQFDGGEETEIFYKNSKSYGWRPAAYDETVELPLNIPAGAVNMVLKWNREGHNDYWWAIDNISIVGSVGPQYLLTKGVAGLELAQDGSYTFDPSHSNYQSLEEGETQELVAEWTVTDAKGGSSASTLTISVSGINIAPVITVISGTDTIEPGVTWADAGATADTGEVVTASGTVDTSTSGTYTITYTATDAAGNVGTATRTITVGDGNFAPVGVDASVEKSKGLVASGKTLVLDMEFGLRPVKATITLPDESEWRDGDMINLRMRLNRENFKLSSPQFSPELEAYLEEKFNIFGDLRMSGDGLFMPGGDEIRIGMLTDFRLMLDGSLSTFIHRFGDGDIDHHDPLLRDLFEDSGFFTFDNSVKVDDRARLEDATSSITSGSLAATDVDQNSVLAFTLDAPVAGLTLATNGNYTFDGNNEAYADLWQGDSREVVADWTVTDQHGATDSRKLTITVKGNGVNPAPVISVTSGTDTVEQGSTWTDAGATADGGETVTASGAVDTSAAGTYTITYTATDGAGNVGTATRTVTVVDTTAPVITVTIGTDTVDQGATWTDAGATADGGETVIVSGTVDTSAAGTTVSVPIVTVITGAVVSSGSDTVELGNSWTDAGATADTGETVSVSGTVD
ncbi:DUF5011 domain-containing protein, partial [Akkermansiaceae bacterium]|nr:DUF5011 domain-containing protein [Akkermansiaceae bacterium]